MTSSNDIIVKILNNLEFTKDNKDASYYRLYRGNNPRVEVRISNHRTHLKYWLLRYGANFFLKNKPYHFISIVFEDSPTKGGQLPRASAGACNTGTWD